MILSRYNPHKGFMGRNEFGKVFAFTPHNREKFLGWIPKYILQKRAWFNLKHPKSKRYPEALQWPKEGK